MLLLAVESFTASADQVLCKVKERKGNFNWETKDIGGLCELDKGTVISSSDTVFSNLRNLDLKEIEIRDERGIEYLPKNIVEKFPNLRALVADECSIKTIGFVNLHGLTKLVKLSLRDNQLDFIHEVSFGDLGALESLYLKSNKIVILPTKLFSKLDKLRFLDLSDNRINRISLAQFENNRDLEQLEINNNQLVIVEVGAFDKLTAVKKILLANNKIATLHVNLFDQCRNLREIDLSGNRITNIPQALLSQLVSLRVVTFSRNPIGVVDFAIFERNRNIMSINLEGLGNAKIKNIDKVDQMGSLRDVRLLDNTCINNEYGLFLAQNMAKLKKDVKARCL